MADILKKSEGVLPWTIDTLETVLAEKGIFVLRNLPTQNGIVYVKYSPNLKKELRELWDAKEFPEIEWFDWYTVDDESFGDTLAQKWIEKYSPKYNLA